MAPWKKRNGSIPTVSTRSIVTLEDEYFNSFGISNGKPDSSEDHFRNPIEHVSSELSTKSMERSALQSFFIFVYHIGVSPYNFVKNSRKRTTFKTIQFFFFVTLALAYALIGLKDTVMHSIEISGDTSIGLYIRVWRYFTQFALQLIFAKALFFHSERFVSMLSVINSTSFSTITASPLKYYFGGWVALVGALRAGFSTIMVLPPQPTQSSTWSSHWRWLLHFRSREITAALSAHTYHDYWNYLSAKDDVQTLTTLTLDTELLGVTGCFMKFTNAALNQFARDSVLIAAFCLWLMSRDFEYDKQPPKEQGIISGNGVQGQAVLKRYKELKLISEGINEAMGSITQILLLDNILLLASFLDGFLNPERIPIQKVAMAFDVSKMLITYFMAVGVASKIIKFRDWLRMEHHQEWMGMNMEQVQWMSDEISTNPIGLGNDVAFIDKKFLIKYFGIAIAYFFATVETRSQAPNCDCDGNGAT